MCQEQNHPIVIGDAGVSQLIERANPQDEGLIKELLAAYDLPYQDLTATLIENFLVLRNEGNLVGCAGLEFYGDAALLRSVALRHSFRNKGLGARLLSEIERAAYGRRVRTLYLLTTTANGFFTRHGYETVDRSSAPETIRNSQEFQSLCPSTAICMFKRLGFT